MSNAAAVEAWLASHAGYCGALHAKITPAQCEALRSRPDQADFYAGSNRGRPPACRTCAGLERQDERIAKEQTTMAKTKKGTCRTCRREPLCLVGYGMCGTCYGKYKAGEIDYEGNPVGEARKAAQVDTSPDAQKCQNSDCPIQDACNGYKTTPTGKPARVAMIPMELRKEIAGKLETAEADPDPFAGLEFEPAPERPINSASEHPRVSLRKCGEIYLNQHVAERLGDAPYARLMYSPAARVLGIRPEKAGGQGVSKLRCDSSRSKKGLSMSGCGPLKAWGLLPAEATSYLAEWSTVHGMWCIKLPEGM